MSKKLGICLGAGGARGIAHVGFLQALDENHIDISVITGCSMGAIVGGLYAMGMHPKEMIDYALKLKTFDILDISAIMIKNKALLKSQKFDKILDGLFGDKLFDELIIPFSCIATDIITGKPHVFHEGLVSKAVRASATIPVAFTPVYFEDKVLVDGALCNRIPVAEARDLGADVVVAVDVLAELPSANQFNNIFDVGFRSLDVMGLNINLFQEEKQKPELLIVPQLENVSQYKVENQQFCFDRGYEIGMANVDKIKELIK